MVYASEASVKMLTRTTMTLTMTVITRAGRDSNYADAVYCTGASALASHALVFRGLVLRGGDSTSLLKTTAWEASSGLLLRYIRFQERRNDVATRGK